MVSKPITSCSVTRWGSTPHGMKCSQRTKTVGAVRPLERGLEGDQPGFTFLGFDIRQYRMDKHQSGKGPRGHGRLGYKTLIKPAKANVTDHLAELGRIINRA